MKTQMDARNKLLHKLEGMEGKRMWKLRENIAEVESSSPWYRKLEAWELKKIAQESHLLLDISSDVSDEDTPLPTMAEIRKAIKHCLRPENWEEHLDAYRQFMQELHPKAWDEYLDKLFGGKPTTNKEQKVVTQ